MGEYSEAEIAFDTTKTKHAVAIAECGRDGVIRFIGEVANSPARIERLIASASRQPYHTAQRRGWSHGGESPSLVM